MPRQSRVELVKQLKAVWAFSRSRTRKSQLLLGNSLRIWSTSLQKQLDSLRRRTQPTAAIRYRLEARLFDQSSFYKNLLLYSALFAQGLHCQLAALYRCMCVVLWL